ncbi:hypothetical protein VE00_09981 [Pseudogymnoascus sp. WSF 3629]|nr:hypothetical protein VE00_09981 [Pseudogymnoascus sp. WSF 3629]
MSKFQDAVKRRAALLQSLEEDGESDPESPPHSPPEPSHSIQLERHWETAPTTAPSALPSIAIPPRNRVLTLEDDSETDDEFPAAPGVKGTRIDQITRLKSNRGLANHQAWLDDLESAFLADPNRNVSMLVSSNTLTCVATGENSCKWHHTTQQEDESPYDFYTRLTSIGLEIGEEIRKVDFQPRLADWLQRSLIRNNRVGQTLQELLSNAQEVWLTYQTGKPTSRIKTTAAVEAAAEMAEEAGSLPLRYQMTSDAAAKSKDSATSQPQYSSHSPSEPIYPVYSACWRTRWGTIKQTPKKRIGSPVSVPDVGSTDCLRIEQAVDTRGTVRAHGKHLRVPIGLDTYAELDFVSLAFVQGLGLRPCLRQKHNHDLPTIEGAGTALIKTHRVYHLTLEITDRWNRTVSFTRPFVAIDRNPQDSPEFARTPKVEVVTAHRFRTKDLARLGAYVYEIRAHFRPLDTDEEEADQSPLDDINPQPPDLTGLPTTLGKRHWAVFNNRRADRLPPHRQTDHAIELMPDKMPPYQRMYNLSLAELHTLEAILCDHS